MNEIHRYSAGPLGALVTHAHPDHYGGIVDLGAGESAHDRVWLLTEHFLMRLSIAPVPARRAA